MKSDIRISSVVALAACLLMSGCANGNKETNSSGSNLNSTEPVTFYAVPLRCPAAPDIGCGSVAKPILRKLEDSAAIEEAWLNRAGTQMAVVWSEPRSSRERRSTIKSVLADWDLKGTELTGHEHAQAMRGFKAEGAWHRADAVDRLSEEEAGIIAARFIRRMQAKTPLSDDKAAMLRSEITKTLKARFVGSPTLTQRMRTVEEEREAFLASAAGYLNTTEVAALRDAVALGLRPMAGEE